MIFHAITHIMTIRGVKSKFQNFFKLAKFRLIIIHSSAKEESVFICVHKFLSPQRASLQMDKTLSGFLTF